MVLEAIPISLRPFVGVYCTLDLIRIWTLLKLTTFFFFFFAFLQDRNVQEIKAGVPLGLPFCQSLSKNSASEIKPFLPFAVTWKKHPRSDLIFSFHRQDVFFHALRNQYRAHASAHDATETHHSILIFFLQDYFSASRLLVIYCKHRCSETTVEQRNDWPFYITTGV